jgi:hypothetical protein
MKKAAPEPEQIMQALRQAARTHADVEEGLACKGTVIESATFKVNGKAFLFLRPGTAMLKLDTSLDEASKLAAEKPACYKVGSGGWATVNLSSPKDLSMDILTRWIAESHGLFAAVKKKRPEGRTKKK